MWPAKPQELPTPELDVFLFYVKMALQCILHEKNWKGIFISGVKTKGKLIENEKVSYEQKSWEMQRKNVFFKKI
jgi:hypothetical protein